MKQMISAAIVATGIALGGLFICLGINKMAVKDRAVTVKGLSTQDVKADFVVWPLNFGLMGNNLQDVYGEIADMQEVVHDFLIKKGFKEKN
jgi:hypothetical protein